MQGILRIAVFYDGSHFNYAQNHFYRRKLGWLSFPPFHKFIEEYVRKHLQGDYEYKVVYSAWYQGLFTTKNADDKQLKTDRRRHHDLMHAGIETKFHPMSQTKGEKGIDVAMAIDILQVGLADIFDVAVLVTGDGDFIPLVRALMKQSRIVINAYFEYEEDGRKSFSNERLKDACSYTLPEIDWCKMDLNDDNEKDEDLPAMLTL
ncbi:MAG: NYN domain-containing protein [Ginsengibacter sp.]